MPRFYSYSYLLILTVVWEWLINRRNRPKVTPEQRAYFRKISESHKP